MAIYAKIEKYNDNGEVQVRYVEPLTLEHIKIVLEDELLEDGEVGESLLITIVELDEEEYKSVASSNGY